MPSELLKIDSTISYSQYVTLKRWYDEGAQPYEKIRVNYKPSELKILREYNEMLRRESGGAHGGDSTYRNIEAYLKKHKGTPLQLVSPWESMILAPSKTLSEHVINFKRRGIEETPFRLNDLLHKSAHLHSISHVDNIIAKLVDRAYKKDLKNGLTGKTKEQHIRDEYKKALIYKTQMGSSYIDALKPLKRIGPQVMDRNDIVVAMTERFWKRQDTIEGKKVKYTYTELSDVGKVLATSLYLEGFVKISRDIEEGKYEKSGRLRNFKMLPPASNSVNERQLLSEHVLKEYYKSYNEFVMSPENNSLDAADQRVNLSAIDDIIRRTCL